MIEGVDTERVSVHAIQTTHCGANVNMSVGLQVGAHQRTPLRTRARPRRPILAPGDAFF